MSSYFYIQDDLNYTNNNTIDRLREYSETKKIQTYVITRPLSDNKFSYAVENSIVVLVPKHKIMILNLGDRLENFENFVSDFVEDLGYISERYAYKKQIGRPKDWKDKLIFSESTSKNIDVRALFAETKLTDPGDVRTGELLISLLTGSINDIELVGNTVPTTLLEKIKRKIILFDGDQTRFIFGSSNKKIIRIQGISGAGKTELLLHKLKELYVQEKDSRILVTCHNKILADSLQNRIPEFFNFMKVEQQIEWGKRLWCFHGWGSRGDANSGAYAKICQHYGLKFLNLGMAGSFEEACKSAVTQLQNMGNIESAFDYILIDESQDFPDSFFELCELTTKSTVYIAGDIFQSIFDDKISASVNADYLLRKCYRTDPKTLMFAHMVGMGLAEDRKFRWLKDDEWVACGYTFEKHGRRYRLWRDPLRRFEDIDDASIESVDFDIYENNLVEQVVSKIKEIRDDHVDVKPDDIGIIFTETNKFMYSSAELLEHNIGLQFQWNVNQAHESKERIPGQVFISNKNNAKGLEFPFVICIANNISDGPAYRNSLYMLISRSFIKTYFLVGNNRNNQHFIERNVAGWAEIFENGFIQVNEPTEAEKILLENTEINLSEKVSLYDLLASIFEELKVEKKHRNKLSKLVTDVFSADDYEEPKVKQFVAQNYSFLKEK